MIVIQMDVVLMLKESVCAKAPEESDERAEALAGSGVMLGESERGSGWCTASAVLRGLGSHKRARLLGTGCSMTNGVAGFCETSEAAGYWVLDDRRGCGVLCLRARLMVTGCS